MTALSNRRSTGPVISPDGRIDPGAGAIVVCAGRKGGGKSVMGLWYTLNYPGDRLIIDVNGDDGPIGEEIWELEGTAEELPTRWPEWRRDGDKPMTIRYVPDVGSPTFLADVDAALGLAIDRGECLVLVHEMGRVFPAGRALPNAARMLQAGRHNGSTTLVACGPRTQGIDKHLLQQADRVYIFPLNGKDDRDAVADNIDWDKREFDAAVSRLRQFEHLVYDATIEPPEPGQPDMRLVHMRPLPAAVVERTVRWAQGYRPKRQEPYPDAQL